MQAQAIGSHQNTYDAVFQHPIARNLQWRDVRSMLTAIADATEEHAETIKFTRNGQSLTVHPPRRKDFSDIQALMDIRQFLTRSAEAPAEQPGEEGAHLLVVIDHRLARVYKTEFHGSVPRQIVPYDAAGAGRHLHHVEGEGNGQRKPELKSFYTAVAKTLERAQKILLFGSGTGSSSAMNHLLSELKENHPDIARRVIGSFVVDDRHTTEDQLLAKAREIYASPTQRGATDNRPD